MDANGHIRLYEAYCSYEVCKLLKEKGFDERTVYHYIIGQPTSLQHNIVYNKYCNSDAENIYVSPTHQMACAWLREEHNIFITIYCGRNGFRDEPYFRATWQRLDDEPMEYPIGDCEYTYYETCVEAAIRYALENLI